MNQLVLMHLLKVRETWWYNFFSACNLACCGVPGSHNSTFEGLMKGRIYDPQWNIVELMMLAMKSGIVFGIFPCSFPWLLGTIASFVWRLLVGCHQPLDGRRGWWWGPDAVNGDATKPHSLFALTAGRCTSAQADAGRDRARAGEDWEMWKFSLAPKDKGKNRWLFCRSGFHFFLF